MNAKAILFFMFTVFSVSQWVNSQVILSIVDSDDHFTISSEELKVKITKNPWYISVYDKNDNLI